MAFIIENLILWKYIPEPGEISVDIPKFPPIEYIAEGAFAGCTELEEVCLFDNRLRVICDGAFYGCTSLKKVHMPNSVEYIGANAFGGCDALTEVTKTQHYVSDKVYEDCILQNEKFISDKNACFGCGEYFDKCGIQKADIPEETVYIGVQAFYKCYDLADVTIPSRTRYICDEAFAYIEGQDALKIPDGVKYIGTDAFYGNTMKELYIPHSVKYIGKTAFAECRHLINAELREGIQHIGEKAFVCCELLKNIYLPASLKYIGENVFAKCRSLEKINVDFENAFFTSEDGVLFSKDKTVLIKYPEGKTDESYTIPDGVKKVGDYAFCRNKNLCKVKIPNSVTEIGKCAFETCTALCEIIIPDSVEGISRGVFEGCDNLPADMIPERLR